MEEVMGLFLGALFLSTPIVFILTKHQQRMTAMLNGIDPKQPGVGNAALHQELATLREIVNQQTIAIDSLAKSQAQLQAALTSERELSERVGA